MSSSQENFATKVDLEKLRLVTKEDLALLRADMNALGSKLSWMVLTCFLTQLAVNVALAGLLYVHLSR
ncbi:MAG TPA: hypothetical protein VHV47_08780 [Opitutaceae bacterium]|nr:hypothetical protein [Opitutaceae bacterium]